VGYAGECQDAEDPPRLRPEHRARIIQVGRAGRTSLACELLERKKFQIKAEARLAIFVFIQGW
jgi:hypothetical protein